MRSVNDRTGVALSGLEDRADPRADLFRLSARRCGGGVDSSGGIGHTPVGRFRQPL